MSFADIGDAAVDQGAGIEQLHGLSGGDGRFLRGLGREVKQFAAFGGAEDHAQIREDQKAEELEEGLRGFGDGGVGNDQSEEERGEQTEETTESGGRKPADLCAAQPQFGEENHHGHEETEAGGRQPAKAERAEVVAEQAGDADKSETKSPGRPRLDEKEVRRRRFVLRGRDGQAGWRRVGQRTAGVLEPQLAHKTSQYGNGRRVNEPAGLRQNEAYPIS